MLTGGGGGVGRRRGRRTTTGSGAGRGSASTTGAGTFTGSTKFATRKLVTKGADGLADGLLEGEHDADGLLDNDGLWCFGSGNNTGVVLALSFLRLRCLAIILFISLPSDGYFRFQCSRTRGCRHLRRGCRHLYSHCESVCAGASRSRSFSNVNAAIRA